MFERGGFILIAIIVLGLVLIAFLTPIAKDIYREFFAYDPCEDQNAPPMAHKFCFT